MRLTRVALLACAASFAAHAATVDPLKEPVPGAIAPASAPTLTEIDGVKVRMITAVSRTPLRELEAHYVQRFDSLGLYSADEVKDIELPNARQVTALDPDRMISFTVILQPGAKGTTTVMVTSAELATRMEKVEASFVPVLPGAQDLTTAKLEWMETVSYSVKATPAEIHAFYRKALAEMGYVEQEGLQFLKGNERIALTVAPGLSARGVLLVRERVPMEKTRR